MEDFLESDMAEVIINHTEELLGEPLTLLKRKFWIGRYELDLLFQDRHGGKLIVELLRGPLDRYHLYKILDYYDVYKDRHPDDFVETMVVANRISPERKERLAKRGVNFREIPGEVISQYLHGQHNQPKSVPPNEKSFIQEKENSQKSIQIPPFVQNYCSTLDSDVQWWLNRYLEYSDQINENTWTRYLEFANYLDNEIKEEKKFPQISPTDSFLKLKDLAIGHFLCSLRPLLEEEKIAILIEHVVPELKPLLELNNFSGAIQEFFKKREEIIEGLVKQSIEDPSFLIHLCTSLSIFWSPSNHFENFRMADYCLSMDIINNLCLSDVVRKTSTRLFSLDAIPIAVNKANQFITRPINFHKNFDKKSGLLDFYFHLTVVLSLKMNSIVRLWNEGEILSQHFIGDGFPSLENPIDIGEELTISAFQNKAYTIDQPCEVLVQTGEVKSIVLLEEATGSCGYKVKYRDDTISFGRIGIKEKEDHLFHIQYHSTNIFLALYEQKVGGKSTWGRIVGELPLVAAIIRDFFICEEREAFYSIQGGAKALNKSKKKRGISIRYLPRFRIRYIGIRDKEYKTQRIDVLGHHVSGHKRKSKTANPLQIQLAEGYGLLIPEGFTFVRPHDRGGHQRIFYRSKSAMKMLYG